MKKLGDQWIEIIDGQEHMVKEVSAISYGDCNGCFLFTVVGCGKITDFAPCSSDTIIKDLGVLKDGLLPCPFCGEYPEILKGKLGYRIRHVCRDSYVMSGTGIYETEQQAIDAWNGRS